MRQNQLPYDLSTMLLSTLLTAAKALWWLLIPLALKLAWQIWQSRRLAASGIDEIDRMDGRTFERYLQIVFAKSGYKVELTKYVGDYGADLVIRKDGEKIVVQAKRYKKNVGISAVQEVVASISKYGCSRAMVMTNSYFTKAARELARVNKVELWDRDRLGKELLAAREPSAPTAASHVPPTARVVSTATAPPADGTSRATPSTTTLAPEDASATGICVVCGKGVSDKVATYCRDNSARFGGRIYCFDHQRQARR
jgi:restriction system protein